LNGLAANAQVLMLAFSILRMVIVRIPEDYGWVPAYPTSGTAIEFCRVHPLHEVAVGKVPLLEHDPAPDVLDNAADDFRERRVRRRLG
jgi:hypothetical protein